MSLTHWLTAPFKALLACTLLSSVLLLPAVAEAADTKIYPGSFCTPRNALGAPSFWHFDGLIMAGETGAEQNEEISCPIVKTIGNNSVLDSVVVETDLGGGGTVSCTLMAHSAHIQEINHNTQLASVTLQVSGVGKQAITFPSFGAGIGTPWQTTNWIYYQFECNLDQYTSILSYKVTEAGTANQNQKIYPPSMCREDEIGTTGRWYQGPRYLQAQQLDVSGEEVAFNCPIITDRASNTQATSVAQIAVGHPIFAGPTLTCVLYASGNYFDLTDSHLNSVPGANGPEFPTVKLDLDINTSSPWARYNIYCYMPASGDSKILGYRVSENN